MIPARGTPWSGWLLEPEDFTYLHDDMGNTLNVSVLAYTWFKLLGDSPCDANKPYRVCSMLYRRLSDPHDFPRMIKEYADLSHQLMQMPKLEDGVITTPHLFRPFSKTPIFREFRQWVRTKDPEIYSFMLTFLGFGRKSEFFDDSVLPPALQGWMDVEEELQNQVLPDHVVEDLRVLIALSGFEMDMDEFWPQHGPGQVSEQLKNKTVHRKNQLMHFDEDSTSVSDWMQEFLEGTPGGSFYFPRRGKRQITASKVVDWAQLAKVPKDRWKPRLICEDPIGNIYQQQGLRSACESSLSKSLFASMTDIHNQGYNRQSALLASRTGEYATLDAEHASDSMSWALISRVMPPDLVWFLDRTRTKKVKFLVEDIFIRINKAFPMGSAMCFVIEDVLFAAFIALSAVVEKSGLDVRDYLSEGIPIVKEFPRIGKFTRIYGDDIILPTTQVGIVIDLLESCSFHINARKSFWGNQAFRESCGMYALAGHDVSPLIFKVRGLARNTYDSWLGLIDLANRSYDKGYLCLRQAIIDCLPADTFFETSFDSCYITQQCAIKGNRIEPNARDRYNRRLQRWERFLLTLVNDDTSSSYNRPGGVKPDIDGNLPPKVKTCKCAKRKCNCGELADLAVYYYGAWLFSPYEGGSAPPRTGLEAPAKVGWRWTPID